MARTHHTRTPRKRPPPDPTRPIRCFANNWRMRGTTLQEQWNQCRLHGIGRMVPDDDEKTGERLECPMCEREGAKNRAWLQRHKKHRTNHR